VERNEMGENCKKVLVRNREVKRSHGRPMYGWEDNIKVECKETGLYDTGWLRIGTTSGVL
jgi:hypothetical protein